jgi:glycosyltransferase involved in cell wall biosynthesis
VKTEWQRLIIFTPGKPLSITNEPLISVIIPSYNRAEFVVDAVKSALGQTYSPLEVIVVDDGSTDETKKRLEPSLNRIRYVHQLNRGVAAARNTGIEAAKGELIAFLDADDLWSPEKLLRQVKVIEDRQEVGLVHSNIYYFGTDVPQDCVTKDGMTVYEGDCYAQLFLRNRITTSSVMVRRECLEKVGLFDERIRKASTEDYDLWIRIARYFEFGYVADPLVFYRVHANNAVNDSGTLIENECYVLEKSMAADPNLIEQVGRQRAHQRLFDIYFSLGYGNFEKGSYNEAHRRFSRALKYRVNPAATLLWTVTKLPPDLIKSMRYLKQCLAFQ